MDINKILSSDLIPKLIKNIGVKEQYKDDLNQEIALLLLEYDKDKIQSIPDEQAKFFITRIIINQYHSTTSPFYKKYRKVSDDIDDRIKDEEKDDCD